MSFDDIRVTWIGYSQTSNTEIFTYKHKYSNYRKLVLSAHSHMQQIRTKNEKKSNSKNVTFWRILMAWVIPSSD